MLFPKQSASLSKTEKKHYFEWIIDIYNLSILKQAAHPQYK